MRWSTSSFLVLAAASVVACGDASVVSDTGEAVSAGETSSAVDAPPTDERPSTVDDDSRRSSTCAQRRVFGEAPPLARMRSCGKLEYGRYANEGQSRTDNILPDFSFAGYRGGGIAIPDVREIERVAPGPGDDRARVQAAIDRVSARALDGNGFRGAVVLEAGTYQVGDELRIGATGVVLRGAGQGTGGTLLVATKREQHSLITVGGAGSGIEEVDGSRVRITSDVVAVGAVRFNVASTAGLSVGDRVAVVRTPNQRWIDELGMDRFGADDTPWTPSAYAIAHERRIVVVDGNRVTVDIPIVDTMEVRYGGGALYKARVPGRIQRSGVEDLRLVSEFSGPNDEQHGWNAVRLSRVENGWVRRVTAVHFGYAAVTVVNRANFNTIEEVAQLDPVSRVTGGRRYSFNVSSGMGNLFQRCYARDGRHNFVTGARVTGPNVWLDCVSVRNNSDEGPHHRWATGVLFDNVSSAELYVQNRRGSGTGHGWAGAQTMFWNCRGDRLICDAPRGAMNWLVGTSGSRREGRWAPEEPFGWWESHGDRVAPRSLYLQQLEDRLSRSAVIATTTPAQRAGTIWADLTAWAGNGRLDGEGPVGDPTCRDGIVAGDICCSASCGSCGGTGCGGRPGGASACCTSAIRGSGRSCETATAPCVIPEEPVCDGILNGDVCCAASCGTCGGSGCGGRPGGAASCCSGAIRAAGRSCAEHSAPCLVP